MSGPADGAGDSRPLQVNPRRRGLLGSRAVRELPAFRQGLAMFGAVAAVQTAAVVAQAVLLARVVTLVFVRRRGLDAVAHDIVWLAVAMAVKALCAGAMERAGQRASALVRSQLRHRLLACLVRLGPHWLSTADRGTLVSAAGPGTEALDGYVSRALPAVVSACITPPVVLAVIGIADWQSLLVLAVTVPLVPMFMVFIGVTTKRRMDRQWAALGKLAGQFLDLLEGLTTLKIYGRSRAQVAAVDQGTDRYRRRTLATLKVAFLSGLALDLLASLSVALVAVDVGLRLDHGSIGLLPALTVLLLAPEVFVSLRALGANHHASEEARAVLGTAAELMDAADRLPEPLGQGAGPLVAASGEPVVRARGVSLTYDQRGQAALSGVNLTIRAAQLTVLTGPSGAGKTSLLSLLLGRLAPTEGTIVAGPDERPVPTGPLAESWRRGVAWAPQRPRPTQATVADEVRMGAPGATDAEVARVLAICSAPPPGTALGEDGNALSAGQRRRVALARVVARARSLRADGCVPLVLLDEPTEELDAASRQVVVDVVANLAGWAAVVVSTHDARLTELADQNVQVDNGRVTVEIRRRCSLRALAATAPGPAVTSPDLWTDDRPVPGTAKPVPATVKAGPPAEGATAGPPAGPRHPFWQLWGRDRRARRSLALACALGALSGISGLALTGTSTWLICRAAQHPNVQALAIAVVGVRTFALAKAFFRYGERLAAHDGALRLLARTRARVFASLEPLAPAGLGQFRRGDLLRRFTTDVDGAQEALVRAIVPLVGAGFTTAAALGLTAFVSAPAAAVLAVGVVAAGVAVPLAVRRWAGTGQVAAVLAGKREALTGGLIDGLDELDAYGAAATRLQLVGELDQEAVVAGRPGRRSAAAGALAAGLCAAVCVPGVLAAAARGAATGHVRGILVGVAAVAGLVAFDALGNLPAAFSALARCVAGWRRVEQVLAQPVPVPEPAQPLPVPAYVASVRAEDLALAPAPEAPDVLWGAYLDVARGQRVAVVGPSGSGKTTLLCGLLRLLAPSSGRIRIGNTQGGVTQGGVAQGGVVQGGVDIARLRAADIPPLVAGSLQGDHVFSTTLRDNLKIVAPHATDADLDAIADRVGLGSWARSLPQGWSTQAGPDGSLLSGGQRQRLLLARALLAAPEVLVLDEPTAHLDAVTEAAVMADVRRATQGRTLIASTHRADLLDGFDLVVNLEDGQLVPVTERQGRPTPRALAGVGADKVRPDGLLSAEWPPPTDGRMLEI